MKTIHVLCFVAVLAIVVVLSSCSNPRVIAVLGDPVEPGAPRAGTVVRGNERPDPLSVDGSSLFTGVLRIPAPAPEIAE